MAKEKFRLREQKVIIFVSCQTTLQRGREIQNFSPGEFFTETACSICLGMSTTTAMSPAEHIYTTGYISYPMTDTTAYAPTDFQADY